MNAMTPTLTTRSAVSIRPRVSAREGIYDQVHAEARVIDGREALVVGVVVPFGAVVLVAEKHLDPAILHHRFQILVDEIVAPAVELVTRCRRTIVELEEAGVNRVGFRKIDGLSERARDFLEGGLAEDSVDVVV